jgi:glucokinase
MQILAGDIGGTHTRLALFDATDSSKFTLILEQTYSSQEHNSIETILEKFLTHTNLPPIRHACFGLAGPVIDQVCETTNLPWRVDATQINQHFRFHHTWLLNDLEANAWGIDTLPTDDLHRLYPGSPTAKGNRSIISAGTGLGEAGLFWDGQHYHPFPSEGGHSDFSPATPFEYALYEHLAKQYGHVSWERLVCGPGLENIYTFLLQETGGATPTWLKQTMDTMGMAPAISQAAITQKDDVCQKTMALFIQLYAREAANHALKIMATGGVYLGGGIVPKILPLLQTHDFIKHFLDKGRMQPIMASMPVNIILNDKTALMGAAYFAHCHA